MNKILIALVLAVVMSGNAYSEKASQKEIFDELSYWMKGTNKLMPLQLDNLTTVNSVKYAGPNRKGEHIITYYNQFTLNIIDLGVKISSNWDFFEKGLYDQISMFYCTQPEMKFIKENDIIAIYNYTDIDNKFVFNIGTSSKDCD
ncbi:hypothetical protein N9H74_06255 [Hyphomicrobiales bacterium]|nr:hypothetical protein [Hyphomicrobiales bacterium]